MKLLVATDAHIYETPDGRHWTPAIYSYSFWKRYLQVFETVRIVARTKKVDLLPDKMLLVDGEGIEIFSIPFYQGPKQLAQVYVKIHRTLKNVTQGCDVAIFRMPSQTAEMVYKHTKGKMPVGGEIVYDPTDDINNPTDGTLIRLFDIVTSKRLKKFCKEANGVSYVTKQSIQKHYPSYARLFGEDVTHFETYYSTITLNEDAFYKPRTFDNKERICVCLSDVSMNTDRKGEPILLKTIKKTRDRGYDVTGIIIGDGSMKSTYERLAKKLGVDEFVEFTGRLPSAADVRTVLRRCDIFVFPTQAEGLPRGILEAMAVGMPVLSTPVGGIPEVIDSRFLFNPNDINGFSNMICFLMDNKEQLNEMSRINYEKSLEYGNAILQKRRNTFYEKLKDLAAKAI